MNKKQIFLFSLILTLIANSIFAFNLDENKTDKKQPDIIQKVVVKENKEILVKKEGFKVEKKPTLKEVFFEKIKSAKNEEERKIIYSQFKKALEVKKTNTFEEKTKKVFAVFDNILLKLDQVKGIIEKNVEIFKKDGIDLSLIDKKTQELNMHLDNAKAEKTMAWIAMQEINFNNGEKNKILEQLANVKEHLIVSRSEIKKASLNSKELIFFIRGALINLK